jgi:hypothetical protein
MLFNFVAYPARDPLPLAARALGGAKGIFTHFAYTRSRHTRYGRAQVLDVGSQFLDIIAQLFHLGLRCRHDILVCAA